MEGFKKLAKGVKAFKEGGSVYESRKKMKEETVADIAQDKAIVKKGVKQHESALHKGEPKTELKLKTGGRAKKSKGTVKKYAAGGDVMAGVDAKLSALEKQRAMQKMARAKKYLNPSQQSELISQSPEAAGLKSPLPMPPSTPPAPMPAPAPTPGAAPAPALGGGLAGLGKPAPAPAPAPAPMKKGGKAKGKC